MKSPRFNLVADHMTLLLDPALYKPFYVLARIVFGVAREGIIYEKRKRWPGAAAETSMTFAMDLGNVMEEAPARQAARHSLRRRGGFRGTRGRLVEGARAARTMLAVVQPSEPATQRSHVREMLAQHRAAAHLQHIALRTPDLFAFHEHARARGVNFITPVLRDHGEDLLQVFSGELYGPGGRPSGLFFEFVQRTLTRHSIELLRRQDRQSFFRDRTFLGLYAEKEREYQSGSVTPFVDHELLREIQRALARLELWDIREGDVDRVERILLDYGNARRLANPTGTREAPGVRGRRVFVE